MIASQWESFQKMNTWKVENTFLSQKFDFLFFKSPPTIEKENRVSGGQDPMTITTRKYFNLIPRPILQDPSF